MSEAFAAIARRYAGQSSPVWLWDVERARIAWANKPALEFFAETSLADLTERPFAPANPLRRALKKIASRLREGGSVTERLKFRPAEAQVSVEAEIFDAPLGERRVLVIRVLAEHEHHIDPALERAKLAFDLVARPLALFDMRGACLLANAAFQDAMGNDVSLRLLVQDADAFIEHALGDGDAVLTREIETRFGSRLHRLAAQRASDPSSGAALVLVEFTDIADRRALESMDERKPRVEVEKIEASAVPGTLTGAVKLNVESIDVEDLARQSVRLAASLAGTQRVTFTLDIAGDLPRIAADRRSVSQVLANVLENAVQCGAGGEAVLRARVLADGAVELRVTHQGDGIGEEEAGPGLPQAKALAEANHAEFVIESAKGKGTVIRLIFPSPLVLAA